MRWLLAVHVATAPSLNPCHITSAVPILCLPRLPPTATSPYHTLGAAPTGQNKGPQELPSPPSAACCHTLPAPTHLGQRDQCEAADCNGDKAHHPHGHAAHSRHSCEAAGDEQGQHHNQQQCGHLHSTRAWRASGFSAGILAGKCDWRSHRAPPVRAQQLPGPLDTCQVAACGSLSLCQVFTTA